ncbi:MAG: 16S rRNA (uracil(1498)-N(3))-methyltransferase [Elusimicrobia bacterium]|nr:16S rRNA (uracil(1498)-N(3))-methyltransferase [Elusimicrobiota bacterium]
MPHFYTEPQNIVGDTFVMNADGARYLCSVRRFCVGDIINIFDGTGKTYRARITKISKTLVEGKIISSLPFVPPACKVTLYTAIPKADKFEWLLEKAAELGVHKIVPLITERSIAESFSPNKIARLNKISIAASSQCGRADIMALATPASFKNAMQVEGLKIMAYEGGAPSLVKVVSKEILTENINIFIGPEGGFSSAEVETALNLGAVTAALGKNILRVETAAIVCAALIINLAEA